jgi:sec-independent protein translocase protein TatC
MAIAMGRPTNPEGRMALVDHLRELRNRLFKSAIGVVLGTVAGFILYQPMLSALIKPITDLNEKEGRLASLNFDGVASSFDLMIQISVFMGLILASPVWLYQKSVWRFPSWPLPSHCLLAASSWHGWSFPTPYGS